MAATMLVRFAKCSLSLLLLGASLLSLDARAATEQSLDNIVAIVNDEVITQSELNRSVHMAERQLTADNIQMPPMKSLRKQILQQLINQKIQVEAAEQSGIKVDEHELDEVVNHIAKENGLSPQEFYQRLAQEGFTAKSYRKQMKETLSLQRLQQREVASRINVQPDEIDDFLHSAQQRASGEKEYQIQDILVAFSDSPTPQEIAIAKKFAGDITAKLRKGTRLSDLPPAETQSLQDNDLGWRKLAEVPTAFTDLVTKMGTHEYSAPIQTANGFHIIHLLGQRTLASPVKTPERAEVAQMLFQRKFEEALPVWISKIRSQSFVVIQDKAIA